MNLEQLKRYIPQFPVLEFTRYKGAPSTIPWELIEPHASQIIKNHGETLCSLAYRGGLDPLELYYAMTSHELMELREHQIKIIGAIAVDYLNTAIDAYQATVEENKRAKASFIDL